MLLPDHPRPLIMGILNVTPDSFSGDGLLTHTDYVGATVKLGLQMMEEGAAILDIGGESSRPGAEPVSAAEEIRRVVPVVKALKKIQLGENCTVPLPLREGLGEGAISNSNIQISGAPPLLTSPARGEEYHRSNLRQKFLIAVDTTKASVAEAALQAGAAMINDISALKGDPQMAATVAKHGAYLVLMHNRSKAAAVMYDAKVGGEYKEPVYGNVIEDVKRDQLAAVEEAKQSGVVADKIILDPGIGFGKNLEQNLALINHLGDLKALGYPVLVGPSRKSFIGRALDLMVDERLEGTAACVAAATLRGADIIRVHDVQFMARVAKMTALIAKV